ncbi:MAG: cobalamin-independent methionine synthase II family protein, partial [Candidatus Dormibacteraceae bacterium]
DGQSVSGIEERVRRAVEDIVREQVAAGVDVVNDGEQGKISYATYIKDRLTGFEGDIGGVAPLDVIAHPDFGERMASLMSSIRIAQPACTGDIRRVDHESVHTDIANLKAAAKAAGAERVFMTAASPGVVAMFFANRHYGSREAYLAAIADAMREEYEAIAAAGITLQLDCPDLGAGASMSTEGLDARRRDVGLAIEALNDAVRSIPPEQLRLHVCWGNYEGPHDKDVELTDLLDLILRARPAGLSIEAANPRHAHEWEVFAGARVPDEKYLIPGVVDSTNNYVEHPRLVAQRLVNYGRVVGRDRVMAGSDCGFGTFVGQVNVVPSVTWAKLQSMAEGARIAWAQLA